MIVKKPTMSQRLKHNNDEGGSGKVDSAAQRNVQETADGRRFNGPYTGNHLDHVAFPLGGIGAGMVCMEGNGAISHVSVRNRPDMFNEPFMFAALSVKGIDNGVMDEAPVRVQVRTGNGAHFVLYENEWPIARTLYRRCR